MNQPIDFMGIEIRLADTIENPLRWVFRSGEALRVLQIPRVFVEANQIGEGTPDVDCYPQTHSLAPLECPDVDGTVRHASTTEITVVPDANPGLKLRISTGSARLFFPIRRATESRRYWLRVTADSGRWRNQSLENQLQSHLNLTVPSRTQYRITRCLVGSRATATELTWR
jgi:hypothetical protein